MCKCNQGHLNNLNIIIGPLIINFYFRKTFLKSAGQYALAQMIGYSSDDIAWFDQQTGSAFKKNGNIMSNTILSTAITTMILTRKEI